VREQQPVSINKEASARCLRSKREDASGETLTCIPIDAQTNGLLSAFTPTLKSTKAPKKITTEKIAGRRTSRAAGGSCGTLRVSVMNSGTQSTRIMTVLVKETRMKTPENCEENKERVIRERRGREREQTADKRGSSQNQDSLKKATDSYVRRGLLVRSPSEFLVESKGCPIGAEMEAAKRPKRATRQTAFDLLLFRRSRR